MATLGDATRDAVSALPWQVVGGGDQGQLGPRGCDALARLHLPRLLASLQHQWRERDVCEPLLVDELLVRRPAIGVVDERARRNLPAPAPTSARPSAQRRQPDQPPEAVPQLPQLQPLPPSPQPPRTATNAAAAAGRRTQTAGSQRGEAEGSH